MPSIETQVVEHLYRSLLGREPDEGAAVNCAAHLASGGTVEELRAMITGSEEYRVRQRPKSDHPLAHIGAVWREENLSYFTHRGRYRPLSLTIETVNICNNDCVICPYSAQTRRKQAMPMDLFARVVDGYTEIGGGPVGLTPMVGEILLDKLLLERLKMLRAAPAVTAVSAISNASMAHLYTDAELAEILSHFDRLAISIYGLDAEEFRLMARKDGYDRFRAGLVRILAIMGPERVTLGARQLRRRPAAEVEEWGAAVARDAGVDPAAVTVHTTSTYANWGVFDTGKPLPMDAEWLPVRQNTAQCALPLISLQILSDGTVSFCGCANFDGTSELNLGNVRDISLRDLLGSERVRRLWNWDEFGIPDFCKSCSFHMPVQALAGLPSAFPEPLRTFGG
ncbi:radical SAM/SPASM domain-containing protein [Pararoseomonas sp. SCSIO 73927]|uniref:radical SAM/SPASM domain-containing protein n=1 Tax=Pararoseomonas sp. SCSIO 73927 TaxID=3114537 RepID=UPI0030CFF958